MNRHERRANQKTLLKVLESVIAKRPCDGCSACCTTLGVPAAQTKSGERCQHVSVSGGCSIYATRPTDCREYACSWKMGIGSHEQRPDKVGFTITPARAQLGLHPAWLVHELWKGAAATPDAEALLQRLANPHIVVVMRDERAIARIFFPPERSEEVRRFVASHTVEGSILP